MEDVKSVHFVYCLHKLFGDDSNFNFCDRINVALIDFTSLLSEMVKVHADYILCDNNSSISQHFQRQILDQLHGPLFALTFFKAFYFTLQIDLDFRAFV